MKNSKFKIKNGYDTFLTTCHSRADGNLNVRQGNDVDTPQPTQFLNFNFLS
mgnify:CR=1 FL=1